MKKLSELSLSDLIAMFDNYAQSSSFGLTAITYEQFQKVRMELEKRINQIDFTR